MPDRRVAIVGMGAVLPTGPGQPRDPGTIAHGDAALQSFWQMVESGSDAMRDVPPQRWSASPDRVYQPGAPAADKVYSVRGCFLDPGIEAARESFGIDEGLLGRLDPLYRVALLAGHRAFADARVGASARARTGVILGSIALPTDATNAMAREVLGGAGAPPSGMDPLNRRVTGLPAGLLAASLKLGGGSMTLDAACASSLYALKLACDELVAGRADAMLAGGVSRPDCLYTQMGFSQLRALSPDGICAPFSSRANGLVVGEGAGVFVLKRLADAQRDGDRIHGVICGFGLSNDVGGRLLAPDSEGQLRAMRDAYAGAGWDPADVDLVECHGTGTPTGDAVEIESLQALWKDAAPRAEPCVIGSVKSNIGHLLTGAGAAGLTKVLLAFRNGTLPPTAHFEQPPGKPAPFRVLGSAAAWPGRADGRPRRAAVSAFGFGGINAHLLLEEPPPEKSRAVASPATLAGDARERGPVAIVGLAARIGSWSTLGAFKERVFGGDARTRPAPHPAWRDLERSAPFRERGLKAEDAHGHFIPELRVDPARFRIPPREMQEMLPQQILMLQAAADALQDANIPGNLGPRAGIFVGLGLDLNTTNFQFRWNAAAADSSSHGPALNANRTMGALGGLVASRLAREFRCGGPSFTLSSEESSGVRALEMAVRALQCGELDRALVGAVDLCGDPRSILALRDEGRLDAARPPADGAVAVVVKRLEDAERDGDRVYAVIRGVGCASGVQAGSASPGGGVVPAVTQEACAEALRRACADSGVDAASLGYVETSGSALAREAALEGAGLAEGCGAGAGKPCALGTVAAEAGYLGAAAGLAGVVKTALCLYQEILPAGGGTGLQVRADRAFFEPKTAQYWLQDRADGPRRAGVNAIGADGNAVHVILEARAGAETAQVARERRQPLGPRQEAIFVLREAAALERLAALRARFEGNSVEGLAREWHAASAGPRGPAMVLLARGLEDLDEQIGHARRMQDGTASAAQARQAGVFPAMTGLGRDPKVAFVYPGSGNHFVGMGRDLSTQFPEVLRRQDRENALLRSQLVGDYFWNGDALPGQRPDGNAFLFGQVALGALMSDVVLGFGVRPGMVLGYSLGESASFFGMRAWTDRDGMYRRMRASPLFTRELGGTCNAARRTWNLRAGEAFEWTVGVLPLPAARVQEALQGHDRVRLLIVNTPGECVIGGDAPAVAGFVKKLGVAFHALGGVTIAHCDIVRAVEKEYRDLHVLPTRAPAGVRFYSGATGREYALDEGSAADAVLGQALHGIDFPRLVERAYADGARIFVELGPGGSCSRMIGKILDGRPHVARPCCVAGQEGMSTMLRLLASLVAAGVDVDLDALYGGERGPDARGSAPGPGEVVVQTGGPEFEPRPPATAPPPRTAAAASPPANDAVLAFAAVQREQLRAHEAYLSFSNAMTESVARVLAFQDRVGRPAAQAGTVAAPVFLDRSQCLAFAIGKIGDVLGPEFAPVDAHPTRVRLPDEPLMLVDRILSVEGEPRSMSSGRVVTEHDILPGAWYLDAGRIPTCIAVEAGQADLFLSGYLGIDFVTGGASTYRLLDAVITFHRSLPGPGETIHYDIRINQFFRQGNTWLFRFQFEGTVNGERLLSMRDGCAGFFSRAELEAGKGIVRTALDRRRQPGKRPADWTPLVPMVRESYDDAQLEALRAGDLPGCFGESFARLPLRNPLTLPGAQDARMKLVHRILELDPEGGRFGIGLIRGEADIHPKDWFLTCHFVDDRVMPGTLMYECCLHTLRVFLLRMGWVAEQDEAACEPVPGVSSQLKCRGQVLETTRKVTYEITIKELDYRPDATVIADALMYADGHPIVEMSNMSLRISGLTLEKLKATWKGRGASPEGPASGRKPAIYDRASILAYSNGKPSEAFGEPYRVFDSERVLARLPGPPYLCMDRVTAIQGNPWQMVAGTQVEAQYDVPPDAWYFAAESQPTMPFAILLETALQPCGWLAAYVGSALTSRTDLSFRNLGGKATQMRAVSPQSGTLTTRVTLTKVSNSGGMVIQHYDFELSDAAGKVYAGNTYFGFFSKTALSQQVGLRDAKVYEPDAAQKARARTFDYPRSAPFPVDPLRMIDRVALWIPDGGASGLGFIRGVKDVIPDEWFFKAHFYQDPVWPGSLGLEAFLQLMKVAARERWNCSAFESVALGSPQEWVYRGQVIPTDRQVQVQASITRVDDVKREIQADGFLTVDGRVIYQMNGFAIRAK